MDKKGAMITRLKQIFKQEKIDHLWVESFTQAQRPEGTEVAFKCRIPQLKTHCLTLCSGWFIPSSEAVFPKGLIVTSLSLAKQKYPELYARYNAAIDATDQASVPFISEIYSEGLFIYVEENAQIELPIQILNTISGDGPSFIQAKNLIVLGANSELKLIQCDDSLNHLPSFSNNRTKIVMERSAKLDYYKLQNINDQSGMVNTMFFSLKEKSFLNATSISLNGGYVKNDMQVSFNGEHGEANVHGLYVMDKAQHIHNLILVNHNEPHCTSREWYKGVLDDSAQGYFKGYIRVAAHAHDSNAQQNNNNILLSNKAHIDSKPFLEINNDDVKCAHGVTVGQLDEDALFYLRSRGIGEAMANHLLLSAFCDEIIAKIGLSPLREQLLQMIERRIKGELSPNNHCFYL